MSVGYCIWQVVCDSLPPAFCSKWGWQLTTFIFHTGAANLILKFEKLKFGFTPAGLRWAPGLRSLPGAAFVKNLLDWQNAEA